MKPAFSLSQSDPRRGSAFITVIMFVAMMFILCGSILSWSLTERRLNARNAFWLEARYAAEALAEYGFAQVVTSYSSSSTQILFDPLGTTPLTLPPATFFAGGNVTTSTYSSSNPYGMELIGSDYRVSSVPSSGGLYYVDPTNPDNQFDPLKGQYVYRRDIQVIARASVVPPTGSPLTAYVTESVSIRGAPLFSHAIFYSANDLEIAPGPVMNIYGPVHVNGNLFVSSQGSSLNFYGPVSASGDVYHSWQNVNTAAEGAGSEALGTTPVTFENSSNTLVNMQVASSGAWMDSTKGADSALVNSSGQYKSTSTDALTQLKPLLDSSFRQYAAQTWNGNLQTSAMGVAAYYPISFDEVIDAAGDKPDPHALIDPPTVVPTSDPYYAAKEQVEGQKMSMQSGLYIKVTVNPGSSGSPQDGYSVTAYGPANATGGTGPNGGVALSTTLPPGLITFKPFQAHATGNTTTTGQQVSYSATGSGSSWKIKTTTATGGTITQPTTRSFYGSGSSDTLSAGAFSGGATSNTTGSNVYGSAAAALLAAPGGGATVVAATGTPATTITSSTYTLDNSMYDQRRQMGIDQIVLDMGQLKKAVQEMVLSGSSGSTANAIKNADNTTTWTGWNGAVYIDVQAPNYQTSAQSASVVLTNATVTSGQSLIPSYGPNPGLTIATNAPVYIKGNFNADGSNTSATASATTPDDGKTGAVGSTSAENPICIAADAVTILSNAWSDSTSYSTNKPTASNTEVAAALLVGLQPTSNTANSGGAHNLPRFLENWGGIYATIRGSLVTMFSCKVATQPWSTAYYGAPNRNWGFDQIFKNGNYPPITPKVMSFRRIMFRDFTNYPNLNSSTTNNYLLTRAALWPSRYTYP